MQQRMVLVPSILYKAMANHERIPLKVIAGYPISCKVRINTLVRVLLSSMFSNNHRTQMKIHHEINKDEVSTHIR